VPFLRSQSFFSPPRFLLPWGSRSRFTNAFLGCRLLLPSGFASKPSRSTISWVDRSAGYGRLRESWKKPHNLRDRRLRSMGKPATNIKLIAYLPGCKIATLNIPLLGRRHRKDGFRASRSDEISLRGANLSRVHHAGATGGSRGSPISLCGDHQFFGIYDGHGYDNSSSEPLYPTQMDSSRSKLPNLTQTD